MIPLKEVTLPFYIVGICDVFCNSTYRKTVNDSSPDLAKCDSKVCLMMVKKKEKLYEMLQNNLYVKVFISSKN